MLPLLATVLSATFENASFYAAFSSDVSVFPKREVHLLTGSLARTGNSTVQARER